MKSTDMAAPVRPYNVHAWLSSWDQGPVVWTTYGGGEAALA